MLKILLRELRLIECGDPTGKIVNSQSVGE
jgi:hypothetical protein